MPVKNNIGHPASNNCFSFYVKTLKNKKARCCSGHRAKGGLMREEFMKNLSDGKFLGVAIGTPSRNQMNDPTERPG